MKNNRSLSLMRTLDGVAIVASLVLMLSLSLDITTRRTYVLSPGVEELQLVVCMVFVMDYILRTMLSESPNRYFWDHIPMLIVSIPWLNMLEWGGAELPKGLYICLKSLPMVRGAAGLYQVIKYITPTRVSAIMWSYIALIVLLSYLSALIFYSYEEGVNPACNSFGTALWWAGMNVTTVGASLFAVTPVGKILTVLLPGLGMVLFPLLTVYVTHVVQRSTKR